LTVWIFKRAVPCLEAGNKKITSPGYKGKLGGIGKANLEHYQKRKEAWEATIKNAKKNSELLTKEKRGGD